jgi:hypothetical protein
MKVYGKFYFTILILILALSCGICFGKDKPESFAGQGYVGTLPNLTKNNEPAEPKQTTPEVMPSKDFNSENELKPVPRDNPAFVNIILKTDKTSQYVNDLNEFIPMLENIYDLIEDEGNVQIFNAKVYYFNKNTDYFRDKYNNKPESQFVSYKRLMELSMHARSIALLRTEAEKYNPYLAYGSSGYIYNPNNLREQLDYLKDEIRQTILILRESN